MMYKSERREIQRRNARKMRVHGRGVFDMAAAQDKRDRKRAFRAQREAKAFHAPIDGDLTAVR